MLQVKNLVKIYKPKKGVPVRALDNVSLTFPKTGMVFLLGKSGSGKSTLLNLLGGLDRYDGGDILIQGESTKRFRQSHFDSYRNTYVGFIFQEYNILDEFSVGTNIALALQLQGQKADSQRVNEILREVDLDGYGNRKPNELSGGQKQRVAIARALVKNPKIIMADEPTGALDSTTGRQVLTTLKKLSRDKLVIVVSHDREFAEQYADRIIELADGRVIRDVEKQYDVTAESAVPVYMEESVSLPDSYELTEEDREAICDYIQKMVKVGKEPKFAIVGKNTASFQPTDTSRIQTSHEGYKLIKSRLPLQYAFKMGASGLKHKKFRLVMTILLSCIALVLFGLADTVASYDYVTTAYNSLLDQEDPVTYAAFEKSVTIKEDEYEYTSYGSLTKEDLERIEDETGMEFVPVYRGSGYSTITNNLKDDPYSQGLNYIFQELGGFVELDEDLLEDMGAELVAGELPREGTNDIALSTVYYDLYETCGYRDWNTNEELEINKEKDLIGKTLYIDGMDFTVCGIVDTGIDLDSYLDQIEDIDLNNADMMDYIQYMFLEKKMTYSLNYSLTGLGMIAPGQSQRLAQIGYLQKDMKLASKTHSNQFYGRDYMATANSDVLKEVVWLDGQERTELAADEFVMTVDAYNWHFEYNVPAELDFNTLYAEGRDYSALANMEFSLSTIQWDWEGQQETLLQEMKLVGIIPYPQTEEYYWDEEIGDYVWEPLPDEEISKYGYQTTCFVSEKLLEDAEAEICQTLAPMPTDNGEIRKLVEFSALEFEEDDDQTVTYGLMNPVSFELKELDMVFEILEQVFFWIGIAFVVFASLLFSNFIGVSISYKKQEIGILRAIGSRSNDVFRIFFAESFCIAMINFALSLGGTVLICLILNEALKASTGLLLTVLNVGIRQVVLLFGVCLLVAAVASFLPVKKIASKRPIDAIRDR